MDIYHSDKGRVIWRQILPQRPRRIFPRKIPVFAKCWVYCRQCFSSWCTHALYKLPDPLSLSTSKCPFTIGGRLSGEINTNMPALIQHWKPTALLRLVLHVVITTGGRQQALSLLTLMSISNVHVVNGSAWKSHGGVSMDDNWNIRIHLSWCTNTTYIYLNLIWNV